MTEFELCLLCATLRGDTPLGRQGCRCRPGDSWPGCDVSEEASLCVLCARGLAGGSSRWSHLACSSCLSWERAVRDRLGRVLLPLGRHSVMNGVRVPLDRLPRRAEEQFPALVNQFAGWDRLQRWRQEEVQRLATLGGLAEEAVSYRDWLELFPVSTEVSRDAYLRLRGVDPAWVVDTFPVIPWHAGRDPDEGEWKPAEIGRPRPGETVAISPGPDGHDVTVATDRLDVWFSARCTELECGWSHRGLAFALVHRHALGHATDGGAAREALSDGSTSSRPDQDPREVRS